MSIKSKLFTAFITLMVCVTTALGIWQLQRLEWKNTVISHFEAAEKRPPLKILTFKDLQNIPEEHKDGAKIEFSGTIDVSAEIHAFGIYKPTPQAQPIGGYWIFSPLKLNDGTTIFLNRGLIPLPEKANIAARNTPIPAQNYQGVLRTNELGNYMTPAPDITKNIWYSRNVVEMAKSIKLTNPPSTYIQLTTPILTSANPAYPIPQPLKLALTNNHLAYALTWFGLALAMVISYVVWQRTKNKASNHL